MMPTAARVVAENTAAIAASSPGSDCAVDTAEPLPAEPQLMLASPCLAAVVHNSLPQQQLRQPVPHRHQIAAAVITGTH